VAFVGFELEGGGLRAEGTGFFANIQQDQLDIGYFVTAAHLIRDAIAPVSIRINMKDGSSSTIRTNKQHWIFHQNKKMDICAPLTRCLHISTTCVPMEILPDDPNSDGNYPFGLRPRLMFAAIGSLAAVAAVLTAIFLLQR